MPEIVYLKAEPILFDVGPLSLSELPAKFEACTVAPDATQGTAASTLAAAAIKTPRRSLPNPISLPLFARTIFDRWIRAVSAATIPAVFYHAAVSFGRASPAGSVVGKTIRVA